MRKLLAVAAVLAIASGAQALTVSASNVQDVQPGDDVVVEISVSGGLAGDMQSFVASLIVPTGQIKSFDPKTGTIWAASSLPVENYFAAADGSDLPAGLPGTVLVYSDYGMPAGTPTASLPQVTSGLLARMVVGTAGLAEGTYAILFATPDTPSGFGIDAAFATQSGAVPSFVAGSFTIVPEPAAALLLGLGGLFLRRRHA